jgi:hypothetical protein
MAPAEREQYANGRKPAAKQECTTKFIDVLIG